MKPIRIVLTCLWLVTYIIVLVAGGVEIVRHWPDVNLIDYSLGYAFGTAMFMSFLMVIWTA